MFGVCVAHFAARVLLCLSFFSLSCLDVPWLLGHALDFFHYSSSLPAGRTPFAASRSSLVILGTPASDQEAIAQLSCELERLHIQSRQSAASASAPPSFFPARGAESQEEVSYVPRKSRGLLRELS